MNSTLSRLLLLALLGIADSAWAQQGDVEQTNEPVMFTADAVARTAKAVNYRSRGGATQINFVGTAQASSASGTARVRNRGATVEVDASFEGLPAPQNFGSEYLTHVLWAISPEGRVSNLGEVQRDKRGRAKLAVTSDLQVFGMVVTAEPYYAVRMPSDAIVMENETTKKTKGRIFFIDAKYELLKRGAYEALANPLALSLDLKNTPLDVYQARNALVIAESAGAEKYAADSIKRARASLEMANNSTITKGKRKDVVTLSRQAVQFAEDARALTVERQQIELEQQRQAETAAARQTSEDETRKREAEEAARLRAEEAKARAEDERLAAERERLAAERKQLQADLEAAREARERAAAEAARAAAERERERARRAALEAEHGRMRAERETQELRQRILGQLSAILPTRDSERGLVVNMGDVLFDVGKYDLRPSAREKLARLSGTVLAFPGLRLKAEGHTDNTGGEELNQRLSGNRAAAVRDYLTSQGISPDMIASEGLGFAQPVADNFTAAGRQANRRVELIISGEVIGAAIGGQ